MPENPLPYSAPHHLIDFILDEMSADGVHILIIGHGEKLALPFGKYNGVLDCNFVDRREFIERAETLTLSRAGYTSFICLTSLPGVVPPPNGTSSFRFDEDKSVRHRYGWLTDFETASPLSSRSLKSLLGKERKVRLHDSFLPKPLIR
jgi:hypothetical protein